MSEDNKTKSYFDKFMDDQLARQAKNRQRQTERIVERDDDVKRNWLRRYREDITHLISRTRKDG